MPYVQHTHCVNSAQYHGIGALAALGGVFAALGLLLAFIGGAVATGPLLSFGVLLILMDVCDYLLGGKLICLGHGRCAIGRVMGLEPPGFRKPWPQNIDNDYSVNILLAPHPHGATIAEIQSDPNQGDLVTEQQASKDHNLPFTVYESEDVNGQFDKDKTYVLHCEFEGDRIRNVCTTADVALSIFTAASFFCLIPVIGWIVCLIVGALALAAVAIAWAASAGGDPNDANPNIGMLEVGTDYVVVRGDWCYDTGHSPGWNEFHPVTYIQRINGAAPWTPYWKEESTPEAYTLFQAVLQEWCYETSKPLDPGTQVDQRDPKNRWCLHPLVDGCEDDDEWPPPPK